jgi:hypothetical protein
VLAKLFWSEGGRALLHWSTLGEERKALLKLIVDNMPLPGSYMAGGTALALILGHRQSIDLDWFCFNHFDPEQLARQLSDLKPFETSDAAKGTLHGIFDRLRITWLYYPNPLLDDFVTTPDMPELKLASLKDIAVMKLAALSHRGSAKDFVDLYFLAKHNINLQDIIKDMPAKFPGKKVNNYHIIKSLAFFDDAESEPLPKMFIEFDWQTLKKYFLEEQVKLMPVLDK